MSPAGIRYIDEFRGADLIKSLSARIRKESVKPVRLMEVCGGHTLSIHKYGLKQFLPGHITLLSGPGCPVCVSSIRFIDQAIVITSLPGAIVVTYGDLLRVPGSRSSLEREKAEGRDIRVVYSVLDAMAIAKANAGKDVVFLAIGFETSAPLTAAAILKAKDENLDNFSVLCSHKVMPPALEALAGADSRIDGFIAPGHVSAVTGTSIYRTLVEKYQRAVVVSGFEPADILQSVLMLVEQIQSGMPAVGNEYTRVVRPGGNPVALAAMSKVFIPADAEWRGLGVVPASGLAIREAFSEFDAARRFNVPVPASRLPKGCICGEVLTGKSTPVDCPLFGRRCTPADPVGACMVSPEGSCNVFHKYRT